MYTNLSVHVKLHETSSFTFIIAITTSSFNEFNLIIYAKWFPHKEEAPTQKTA